MSTEDMPTTNQGAEEKSFAAKIPPTVAAGFQKVASAVGQTTVKVASAVGQTTVNVVKQAFSSGMSNG